MEVEAAGVLLGLTTDAQLALLLLMSMAARLLDGLGEVNGQTGDRTNVNETMSWKVMVIMVLLGIVFEI